ncbi:protein of unknown function [Pararobbsia alpina]
MRLNAKACRMPGKSRWTTPSGQHGMTDAPSPAGRLNVDRLVLLKGAPDAYPPACRAGLFRGQSRDECWMV